MRYSGLSSRLSTVSAEFPTILVHFRTSVYCSVSEPAFSEPDSFQKKKIETKVFIANKDGT
jgi:hypothetical protein